MTGIALVVVVFFLGVAAFIDRAQRAELRRYAVESRARLGLPPPRW